MIVRYSPDFYRQFKKANVRIRNRVDERKEMKMLDDSIAYFVALGTHKELYG